MTDRRTNTVPRKRTKPSTVSSSAFAGQNGTAVGGDGAELAEAASTTRTDISTDDPRHAVLGELEAALRAQPGLDAEGLDFALQHFKEAVFSAPLEPHVDAHNATAWADMLNSLVDSGLLQEADRNDLARDYESATQSLGSPEVARAIEFAKRLEADGEVEALAWLQSQQEDDAAAREQRSSATSAVAKDQITRSRSRRVRGPPQ